MSSFDIPDYLLLLLLALAIVPLLIFFRRIVRIVFVLLRVLVRPIRRRVLRPLGRAAASSAGRVRRASVEAGVSAPVRVGESPMKALLYFLQMETLSERELGTVPDNVRSGIERRGLAFGRVNASKAISAASVDVENVDTARALDAQAAVFHERVFGGDVSPALLYEDSEAAFIISTFKASDTPFFYVSLKFLKNISRNVWKVLVLLTFLLFVYPFAAHYLVESLEFGTNPDFSWLVFGVLFGAWALLMAAVRVAFAVAGVYNGSHFNDFVRQYFAGLLQQYTASLKEFQRVLGSPSAAGADAQEQSELRFAYCHWVAMRTFFLELFCRNMFFQIDRNVLWYRFIVPILFVGAFFLISYLYGLIQPLLGAPDLPIVTAPFAYADTPPRFAVIASTGVLFLLYVFLNAGLLRGFQKELSRADWAFFKKLELGKLLGSIGPLVREIVDRRRNPLQGSPFSPQPHNNHGS